MHTTRVLMAMVLALVAGSGCQHTDASESRREPDPTPVDEPAPDRRARTSPRETSSREPQTRVTDGIPVEEDYEEEAAALITPATLEAELAKLEAEITPK